MRTKYGLLILVMFTTVPLLGQQDKPASPAEVQYKEIADQFRNRQLELSKLYRESTSDDDKLKIRKEMTTMGGDYTPRFLALAAQYPNSSVAADSLIWVVNSGSRFGSRDTAVALNLLAENHIKNEKLATVCQRLRTTSTAEVQAFLQKVLELSPHRDAQGQACFALAYQMERSASRIKGNQEKAVALYQRVQDEFADVAYLNGTLGTRAKSALFAAKNLGIGKTAPEITGEDLNGVKFKLSDYRGKVVVLDFWGHW